MFSIKFSAGFSLLPDLFFPSSVCQASPAPTLAACLFCQEGMESSLMFWILRGILDLLEVSHSFLWFGVNISAGCGSREENLSAVAMVASKHERALDEKSFLWPELETFCQVPWVAITSYKTFQRTGNCWHKDLHSSVSVLSREVLCQQISIFKWWYENFRNCYSV